MVPPPEIPEDPRQSPAQIERMQILGNVTRTIALSLSCLALVLVAAGFILHPGGSHWDDQKHIAVTLAMFGTFTAIASLTACVFAIGHELHDSTPFSRRLKIAISLALISLLIGALTPAI